MFPSQQERKKEIHPIKTSTGEDGIKATYKMRKITNRKCGQTACNSRHAKTQKDNDKVELNQESCKRTREAASIQDVTSLLD
jgi:hypothetical protein